MAPRYQPNCKICGAPRSPRTDMRFCETHLREYNAAAGRKSAGKGATSTTTEYQRLCRYRAEAIRQGADEDAAAAVAIACEIEFQRGTQRTWWLEPFVAAELEYLRRVAPLRADRWAAPGAEEWAAVEDTGWDYEEAV